MNKKIQLMFVFTMATTWQVAFAETTAKYVPFHEVGGISVDEDVTTEVTQPIAIGAEGEFRKTGKGTLVLPTSQFASKGSKRVTITDGTLEVTPGADATDYETAAREVLANAAFWVDDTSTVVDDNGGVTKWCDVRETNKESPTMVYATPYWPTVLASGTQPTYPANEPPVISNTESRTAVFFGGRYSGKTMRWSKSFTTVKHFFAVHGAYNVWGPVIGHTGGRNAGMLVTTSSKYPAVGEYAYYSNYRSDLNKSMVAARWFADGKLIDGCGKVPRKGYQLIEGETGNCDMSANSFYENRFETLVSGNDFKNAPGGDYVCEVAVFTNLLTETERIAVEQYLMKKWNLPYDNGEFMSLSSTDPTKAQTNFHAKVNMIRTTLAAEIAKGATLEVKSTDAAEFSAPISYAGEGTLKITGPGVAIIGPSEVNKYWSGTLDWDGAGPIVTKGGAFPPLSVGAGERYTVGQYGTKHTTQAEDWTNGNKIVKTTVSGSNHATFSGDGWARVNEVKAGVRYLDSSMNVLQLQGKVTKNDALEAEAPIEAVVPNADFELPFDYGELSGHCKKAIPTTGLNGWYCLSGQGNSYFMETVPGGGWTVWQKAIPRGGNRILQLVQTSAAYTKATFPKTGYYEVSFDSKDRYAHEQDFTASHTHYRLCIQLGIGKDATAAMANTFAKFTGDSGDFRRYRFKTGLVEAGENVFLIHSDDRGGDACTFFDNLRITYIADKNDEKCAFKVPNGDFEDMYRPTTAPFMDSTVSYLNKWTGWNFSIADSTSTFAADRWRTNSVVAAVNVSQWLAYWNNVRYTTGTLPIYTLQDYRRGCNALYLAGTAGLAETTFNAPKGKFRLRALLTYPATEYGANWYSEQHNPVRAIIKIGDTEYDLGVIQNTFEGARIGELLTWSTPFEVPEDNQSVTLKLTHTLGAACALVDNLEFVNASEAVEGENLIINGDFEQQNSGWTNCGIASWARDYAWAFGHNILEGYYHASMTYATRFYRSVTVKEAGRYRFKASFRTRNDGYENGTYRCWMKKSGTDTEVDMIKFHNFVARNWHEEEAYVTLEAGTYYFGMTSTIPTTLEQVLYVDNISLVKVPSHVEIASAPSLPANLTINITGEDKRLMLDYSGTANCGAVRYNGTTYFGELSAETNPEFITGPGKLNAVRSGMILLFR